MPYVIVKSKRGRKSSCRVRTAQRDPITNKYKYYSRRGIPCGRAELQRRALYTNENRRRVPR